MNRRFIHHIGTRVGLEGAKRILQPFHGYCDAMFAVPELAQRRTRNRILRKLMKTEYGAHLRVRGPGDVGRIPVVDYDEIEPWIERQRELEGPVLTPDPVIFYEMTSGSSAAAKYIPYTSALRASFTRMFLMWVADVLLYGPCAFSAAKTYISVSPSFLQKSATAKGVPIGLEDDTAYLGAGLRWLMRAFWVGSQEISRAPDAKRFREATCAALLSCADLEIISIWNPTFLAVMLEEIVQNRERYGRLLEKQGEWERAQLLTESPIRWQKMWPDLRLISCWDSAGAQDAAHRLAQEFPTTWIQGKGLLATEAPITLPWCQAKGHLPLLMEVWLELEDDSGGLVPLASAEEGKEYGVVVSQMGGLYRYRLGDRVLVGPRYLNTPTLRFMGKASAVTDLVGEKLHESFVRSAFQHVLPKGQFFVLVPMSGEQPHYVLILGDQVTGEEPNQASSETLLFRVDRALSDSFHYRQARSLGQLGSPKLCLWPSADTEVLMMTARNARRLGDIKPNALWTAPVGSQFRDEILRRTLATSGGVARPGGPSEQNR